MYIGYSDQYGTPAIVLKDELVSPNDVVKMARLEEAFIKNRDGLQFVVRFPGRPIELYTEKALRRSLNSK